MRLYSVLAAAFVATLASPLAAQAQGIPEGAAHGAYVGYNTAGPVGWVVGGVVGGTVGGAKGCLGSDPATATGRPLPIDMAIRRDIRIVTSVIVTPAEADSASTSPHLRAHFVELTIGT